MTGSAGPAGRIGVGGAFQPIPGTQPVSVPGGDGVARIPALPGSPVHAVTAGMVVDVDGRGGLELRGADGAGYGYTGLDPASVASVWAPPRPRGSPRAPPAPRGPSA